ncbi:MULTISPECIES: hypothetical protein [Chryseobacterium]|uniref:Uncharacterized protein n=1 Tax=Chryseobacterium camelliae TaxID=1265445 RepID=A0ABU0TIQ3_9FLAO|nr:MULTISPECIES: hypothetical protein [Chryseobacterium]MDT3409226.1 hypothetical protein [Pseudacidovorax intermedius]MDQ1096912.1 hypothetical protein [Chryseobacterium camelliae]MDQ1100854.1 hypothetical protein [Chryseobacterium sp. SORGH_AS_1048]MDR6084296.1 hypothetical protein [Chryseobacterium sp. SORGH_AS_0909]MDR6132567.1 hypothetical protein [Chryseobacterium sp. SORGH_AS_1175]
MKKKKTNDHQDLSPLSQKEIKKMWNNINTSIGDKKPKKKLHGKQGGNTLIMIFSFTGLLTYGHFIKPESFWANENLQPVILKGRSEIKLPENAASIIDQFFHDELRKIFLKEDPVSDVTSPTQQPFLLNNISSGINVPVTVFNWSSG